MIPIPGINTLIKSVGGIFDEFIHSGEEKAQARLKLGKLQHDMVQQALTYEIEQTKAQAAVIIAEAKSGWLSRSWRPILMLAITTILVNNYIVYPYLNDLEIGKAVMLEFPDQMWNLLTVGVGGYIGGRSAEKIIPKAIEKWRGSKSE